MHQVLCSEDSHVKLLKDTAERWKWQECRGCKNMVPLDVGCFHIMYFDCPFNKSPRFHTNSTIGVIVSVSSVTCVAKFGKRANGPNLTKAALSFLAQAESQMSSIRITVLRQGAKLGTNTFGDA